MKPDFKTNIKCSRRGFLKGLFIAGMAAGTLTIGKSAVMAAEEIAKQPAKKPLVVYFSHSGNTRALAELINNKLHGDILEIVPEAVYPADYQKVLDQAKKEKEQNARPAVKTKIENPDQYDVVLVGYPIWYGTMPMPVKTFIEQNKLDGKKVIPFATHGGDGKGQSVEDLKKMLPNSTIPTTLTVSGSHVKSKTNEIEKWIEGLGQALIDTTIGVPQIYPDGAY